MSATAPHLRHYGDADYSWVGAGLGMLALALGSGYTLAMGEMAGLYVGLSLVCAVAVLLDFRTGAVLLLLLLPVSASSLFPRSLLGITGLNPLNLLVLATVGSYVIHGRLQRAGPVLPQPVVWLYAVPILLAGLIGMGHVREIPSFFYDEEMISFFNERQYLLVSVIKPLVMVAVALMIGAAAARSHKPERFIIAIALSVWFIALVQIGFVIVEGASLAALATPGARSFYEPLGTHANTLGRVHMYALALLLFVWAETKKPGMRLFLLVTLAVVSFALLLTFSRAAIAGAGLLGALFLMWKFNSKSLSLALLLLMLIALLGGEALYSRVTMGFDSGADAVSAGRIEGIWLPLLPELAKNPLFGNGINATLWSFPMITDAMHRVGHPHNAYLEALLDMGVIGTALVLAFYATVWKGFRALGSNAWLTPEMRGLFQGATAALIAFAFTGLTGGSVRPEPETAFLWIAIGLMYGLRNRRPES
jgi:O-antigen ligase